MKNLILPDDEDPDATFETIRLIVENPDQQGRIDKILSAHCEGLSRSRIQNLMDQGQVTINGAVCETASRKLLLNDVVEIFIPPVVSALPKPENIPLDIIFEDDDLIVINKQAGLVVHPGAGNQSGTLVNALLHHCGQTLSGIGGVARPGIVHRLDKDTSGLMVVAKHDAAHHALSDQLADRSLSRIYKALVFKTPFPPIGTIDQPITRHASHRLKMAVGRKNHPDGGRDSRTHYSTEKKFGDAAALMECKLETGRTHQIRVHMQHLGHPLIGDPLYGPQPNALKAALLKNGHTPDIVQKVTDFGRQALHAAHISFVHPSSNKEMHFDADIAADMRGIIDALLLANTRG
jgi:23S rRNA pseudouridine1911/1915/1917 synthase